LSLLLCGIGAVTAMGQQANPSPSPTPAPVDQSLSVPQIAPDYKADQTQLPELGRVGVDMDRQQPLSLRDAIKLAEFDLLGAHGAYDPHLTSQAYYERIVTPALSFLSGGANGAVTTEDVTGTMRVEGLVPRGGGNYRFDFSSARANTNSSFAAFNPQYPSSFTFNFTQPLVRGLSIDLPRRQIEIARKNLSLSDAQFRERAINTITLVQRAYWDLVFSLLNLQVQLDSVHDARAQLEHNKRLVVEGQLAPIDVVAAEAQIATFEQSLYSALEDVARTENILKALIAENQQAAIWSMAIVPTDSVSETVPEISLADAMKLAIDNRPELQQLKLAREINQIDQSYFRNQTRPEIDLTGTYGAVGAAGTLTSTTSPFTASTNLLINHVNQISASPVLNLNLAPIPVPPVTPIPPDLVGGYGRSLDNLLTNRYNTFRVGVSVSLPLRNRTAEAELGRSLVEGQRITTQREQQEEAIQVDVRNSLQVMRSSEARLRAAAANRAASEQQYESEKRRLDAGQSTVFLVLERQTALATARGNELRAQTDLNKAIAELQRATGNALTVNSIVVRVR